MNIFDLIVIGGGPAGYLACERAAQGGFSVLMFEKRELGGVCLNEGCIPTKTLLNSAKIYDYALHGKAYGVTADSVNIDHSVVVERKNKVVKTLVSGVRAKMKAHKITVVKGSAVIDGKSTNGFIVKSDGKSYEARRLLIASGSEAIVPPIPGVEEGIASGVVMTSREILDIKEPPKKLVVIGAGVVGLEMAAYFATIGANVTVIEMLGKIGGYADAELSTMLQNELTSKDIDFRLGCKVTRMNVGARLDSPDIITIEFEQGGIHTIDADAVLLSVGRYAATNGLGLENIGVYTERGAIVTDHNLRTNLPNVYAAGDVNGKSMLAHTAYREAEVAVNHMLGKRDHMRYDAISSVIYTSPEVASVGESEESAKAKGFSFVVKKLPMMYSGRFVAENAKSDGLCKLLFETGSNRLIGAHLMGSYVSEIIYGAAMMIESRWQIDDLKELVFPHPTVCEIIRDTLFN